MIVAVRRNEICILSVRIVLICNPVNDIKNIRGGVTSEVSFVERVVRTEVIDVARSHLSKVLAFGIAVVLLVSKMTTQELNLPVFNECSSGRVRAGCGSTLLHRHPLG
jgi:hypothetical protein